MLQGRVLSTQKPRLDSAIERRVITSIGAGGGTRTHTTVPSSDFKSLASTSSATSAPLVSQGFFRFGQRMFCNCAAPVRGVKKANPGFASGLWRRFANTRTLCHVRLKTGTTFASGGFATTAYGETNDENQSTERGHYPFRCHRYPSVLPGSS